MENEEKIAVVCQCSRCGNLLYLNKNKIRSIRDDIYRDLYCPKCKNITAHLDVGEDEINYELYDYFLDKRYFEYDTK